MQQKNQNGNSTLGYVEDSTSRKSRDSESKEESNVRKIDNINDEEAKKGNISQRIEHRSDNRTMRSSNNLTEHKSNRNEEEENNEEEDDDFGDFEEEESGPNKDGDDMFGDFQENEFKKSDVSENANTAIELSFKEDYDPKSEVIKNLMTSMMGLENEDNSVNDTIEQQDAINDDYHSEIQLSERCQALYNRLTQQPSNLQQINWKKSFIRRQLLLNLQIPINLDEMAPKMSENDAYPDIKLNPKDRERMEMTLKRQIVPFNDLKITSEQLNIVLKNTESQIEDFYGLLQPVSYYKAVCEQNPDRLEREWEELVKIKEKLLEMVSCWDKRVSEVQTDSDIFSEYVENLVGNTQKLRRQRLAGKSK
ncbi:DEBR0S2_03136g1_1 [Brettanomyces bruxellensis]|uniref:DEBR0S2_03136g1_1 n=1 Tax=Dekkera bruxellensis TaxID=5007 RepID=A0A7D9GYK2_DEKBR|nr:DEBR0S2_03136g1_1 [Brettanomyces bruxellensis]